MAPLEVNIPKLKAPGLFHTLTVCLGPRPPGGEQSNPLLFSRLENPVDRGAWQPAVHREQRVAHDWRLLSTYTGPLARRILVSGMTFPGL